MLRKKTKKICQRATYFLLRNHASSSKVISNREFITRCYQIS